MKRRTLLALVGTTGTSALAVGTSAFNVSRVDRAITVGVEEDYDAYLQLEELGSGERSELDGGTLELNVLGDDENDHNDQNPEGIGTDSVYWFGRDAGGSLGEGLFKVTNQGTEPVVIYSSQAETDGVPSVTMFNVDGNTLLTQDDPSPTIGVGQSIKCGVHVDTHNVPIQDEAYDIELTINAEAVSE
ncbi:hypothetical protein [Halobacterium sp. KA-6]|uniref:hypothetical protein n=1 Tax=Halobacterium sp. KA-6 TaxID=2896368 RepID=UPI001E2BF605|nr:hypothetical protein [Halobacterium sp. KA-6]MCD2203019.1 hypothetical protein [Halobacterium sp. KA-6]